MMFHRQGGSSTAEFKADGTWEWGNDRNPNRYGVYEFTDDRSVSLYYIENGKKSLYGTIQDYSQISDGIMHLKVTGTIGSGSAAWEFQTRGPPLD